MAAINIQKCLTLEPNTVEKHLRCHFPLTFGCPFCIWYIWNHQNSRKCIYVKVNVKKNIKIFIFYVPQLISLLSLYYSVISCYFMRCVANLIPSQHRIIHRWPPRPFSQTTCNTTADHWLKNPCFRALLLGNMEGHSTREHFNRHILTGKKIDYEQTILLHNKLHNIIQSTHYCLSFLTMHIQ